MGCEIEKKPKDIPYYYRNHNIIPSPGNEWVCVSGSWIWSVKGIEKAQVEIEDKKADNHAFTPSSREAYGSVTYHGKQYIVWIDSKYSDYISVKGVHYQLKPTWWGSHYNRTHGETQIKGIIPRKSMEQVMDEKRWGAPSLPSFKMPSFEMPDIKFPSIGLAGKGIIGILTIVFIGLLALIALGYSGLGGAAGSHLEK